MQPDQIRLGGKSKKKKKKKKFPELDAFWKMNMKIITPKPYQKLFDSCNQTKLGLGGKAPKLPELGAFWKLNREAPLSKVIIGHK